MQSGLFLDVVVSESAAFLQLLARKDQTLLVGRDAFLVLDLLLDVFDRVRAVHVDYESFACEGFEK